MKYQKTLLITDCEQLFKNPPQCGQWIQLAWCERPSRFHHAVILNGRGVHITAFHFPNAVTGFNRYCNPRKAA